MTIYFNTNAYPRSHPAGSLNNGNHIISSRSRANGFVAHESILEPCGSKLSQSLGKVRGAAYMNDVGEGLKPAIGQGFAKRFWYPALLYVGASIYDKTTRDEQGRKDLSLKRGGKELVFQTLASLCGPILLVNIGQNTIGQGLSSVGDAIKMYKNGKNPIANMSTKSVLTGLKNVGNKTLSGVCSAAKELPNDVWSTIKLFFNDVTHPKESFNRIRDFCSKAEKSFKNIPSKAKISYGKFKADKIKYFFGKNGVLFGTKGLLGEKGLLFGKKSGKVIGGLLAILLLYKPVDKLAEKIVDIPEKIF